MSKLILLPTFTDTRGSLSVIERLLPFDIKRVYYMYQCKLKRGGHRHLKTTQALIAVSGNCSVYTNNGIEKNTYILNSPDQCLILEPEDWHYMDKFSKDCVLLVLASEYFDKSDYIDKEYEN
jgi:wxcM domain protein